MSDDAGALLEPAPPQGHDAVPFKQMLDAYEAVTIGRVDEILGYVVAEEEARFQEIAGQSEALDFFTVNYELGRLVEAGLLEEDTPGTSPEEIELRETQYRSTVFGEWVFAHRDNYAEILDKTGPRG